MRDEEKGRQLGEQMPKEAQQEQNKQEAFRPGTAEGLMAAARSNNRGQFTGGGTGATAQMRKGAQTIGKQEIAKALEILQKYKAGKAMLEQRVIENERWYQLRHWECMRKKNTGGVEPVSGWLFNAIANKHADAMDNFPCANVLPRESDDKPEAERLTSILPVVLDQNDFEGTYDELVDVKAKSGTGIYGIFWDNSLLNGLGDISIRCIDILNLFWEPGIRKIQDSRNVFNVELVDNDLLEEQYPQLKGKLASDNGIVARYIQDENVDTTGKSTVIDWYYKKSGKLHYCKFTGNEVLFATENDPQYQEGWYRHGKYPFVFDPLFRMKDTPAGFGYIDLAKSAQEYIDRGNQAVLQNMLANARPRHFIRSDGSVNEDEYGDYTRDFVHVDGSLGQDSIMPVQGKPLAGIYLTMLDSKVNELKEVTGNRDISTGGTASGVTAASAIAAMQEAGSKLARDNNKSSYRAFREVCLMVIELIRQFYSLPRCFRIMGREGQEKFITYTNEGIAPVQDDEGGMRMPLFDLQISAQKQSPYSKMSQNELALQFYNSGFFNPQMADQALACLDMMDFDRKDFIMTKIQQNGTMLQMMQMMQQQMLGMAAQLEAMQGSNLQQQVMEQFGMMGGTPGMMGAPAQAEGQEALGAEKTGGEASNTKKARQRVADSTAPT